MGSRGQHILLYFSFCANSHGNIALLVLPISLKKVEYSVKELDTIKNIFSRVVLKNL